MKQKAPCQDCPRRKFMCHSMCGDYQRFRKAMDEQIEQRQQENEKGFINKRHLQAYYAKLKEGRK